MHALVDAVLELDQRLHDTDTASFEVRARGKPSHRALTSPVKGCTQSPEASLGMSRVSPVPRDFLYVRLAPDTSTARDRGSASVSVLFVGLTKKLDRGTRSDIIGRIIEHSRRLHRTDASHTGRTGLLVDLSDDQRVAEHECAGVDRTLNTVHTTTLPGSPLGTFTDRSGRLRSPRGTEAVDV